MLGEVVLFGPAALLEEPEDDALEDRDPVMLCCSDLGIERPKPVGPLGGTVNVLPCRDFVDAAAVREVLEVTEEDDGSSSDHSHSSSGTFHAL